jgi:predicted Zn-dependent protease
MASTSAKTANGNTVSQSNPGPVPYLDTTEDISVAVTYPSDWASVIEAIPITLGFIRWACSFADIWNGQFKARASPKSPNNAIP